MRFASYQLSRREKVLLALLAVVAGILFFNKVVLGKQLPACRELQGRLNMAEERLAAARQAAAAANEIAAKAEQARAVWEAARLHLGFTLHGTAPFLEAAQPRDQSLQVLAFRPLPMEKRDPFPVFPYEVTVSGPYPALQDYVSQLESLPALTAIHNLKILARRGNDAAVEASFIIDRYDLGEDHPVPGVIALFPAGRTNAFSPPAGMAAATDGTKGTAVPPGQEGAAGSQVTSSAAAAGAGTLPAGSPPAPGSPKGAGTPPADKLTAPFSPAGEGTLPAEQPPAAALPPPAGNTTANPASSPVLASPAGAGGPPQYTFPRQAEGRLLPGPAFKEPPAGEQDIWLEELRVLRNVGPFFILDRPAALAGMNLGRSIGVNLSNGHNKAELKVDLRGRYSHLQGYAGIDDSAANSSGKVKVTVFADGRRLYQEEIRPGDYPRYLELPLFAVQQLTFNLEWLAEGIGDYDQLLATLASIHFSCRH